MPRRMHLTPEDESFIQWLKEVLIPDLHESGKDATAEDFEHCVDIMERVGYEETRGRKGRDDR